jgi:hypothetical protein
MPIYRWVREEIQKYSFIEGSELKGGKVYFYYLKDGKEKAKKLPFRANKEQIQNMIERIKEDIGYAETKAILDTKVRAAVKADEEKEKSQILLGIA